MSEDEFLKTYAITQQKFKKYIDVGIIHQNEELTDDVARRIALGMTMEKVGFDMNCIKEYIKLSQNKEKNKNKLLIILNKQRVQILDEFHTVQKNIDLIDYLIYSLNKEKTL